MNPVVGAKWLQRFMLNNTFYFLFWCTIMKHESVYMALKLWGYVILLRRYIAEHSVCKTACRVYCQEYIELCVLESSNFK